MRQLYQQHTRSSLWGYVVVYHAVLSDFREPNNNSSIDSLSHGDKNELHHKRGFLFVSKIAFTWPAKLILCTLSPGFTCWTTTNLLRVEMLVFMQNTPYWSTIDAKFNGMLPSRSIGTLQHSLSNTLYLFLCTFWMWGPHRSPIQ